MIEKKLSSEEPPGWTFNVEERSAGVFSVYGWDRAGRTVRLVGEDPKLVLEEGRKAARRLME